MKQAPPTNGAGMEDAIDVGRESRAKIAGLPGIVGRVERHIDHDGSADDVLPRHATPEAGIERILAVVAHCEITILRNLVWKDFFLAGEGSFVGTGWRRKRWTSGVRLLEALAVDPDGAIAHIDKVTRQANDALDVIRLIGIEGRLEDDDLLALGIAPKRNVNVSEWNTGIVADAAHDEVIADEQRVLHGARRNHTRLADGAIDEKKDEANPKPRDDFAPDFLFDGEFRFGSFPGRISHKSPVRLVQIKKSEKGAANEFRLDE